MTNFAIRFSYFLLLVFSLNAYALTESFSIHLVHPDNDAIVSSLKKDLDLTGYMRIGLVQDGMDIVVWVEKKAEIAIGDLERADLEIPPSDPLKASVRPRGVSFELVKPLPAVRIWFTPQGSKKFADFTRRNTKKRVGVVLDGIAISAPLIFEPITSGRVQIQGDFAESRAKQIVDRINELIERNKSM